MGSTAPWTNFPKGDGSWSADKPFNVAWAVWYGDRLLKWRHETRQFATEAEAMAAFNLPYQFGRSVGRFERPGYAPLIARMTHAQARKHMAKNSCAA